MIFPEWSAESRPSEFLRAVEKRAIRIRTLARDAQAGAKVSDSRAVDDVVKRAAFIERMAQYGRTLSAADAIDVCGLLDFQIEKIHSDVDALFASQNEP